MKLSDKILTEKTITRAFIGKVLECLNFKKKKSKKSVFTNSADYWDERYQLGGNSGCGSYSKLAEFKALVLNTFVQENHILEVIEYGCGDGSQLLLANYPQYIGFDVSEKAISICENLFREDKTKKFFISPEKPTEKAQLTISLDVIFHLVEDDVFTKYMCHLFDSSEMFVVVYSSNTDQSISLKAVHVKHRKFSDWVSLNRPDWNLIRHVPNLFPYTGDDSEGSFADFFIYKRG